MTNTLHLLAGSSTTTALNAARDLLAKGANACARSDDGLTPLHVACAYDCLAMVQLLMHYGADPLAEDNHGRTPQSMATGNTQRFLQRMLAKSTKEQRGIIRRLFSCHTAAASTNNSSLMHTIRKKVRRSLNIVRRRSRHVAAPVDGIATNAFTNVVPTFPTRSSVQEHSVWTFSKDRGVRPGYPTVDLMPQPSTSRPIWSTALKTPQGLAAKTSCAKTPDASGAANSRQRRSHSNPEVQGGGIDYASVGPVPAQASNVRTPPTYRSTAPARSTKRAVAVLAYPRRTPARSPNVVKARCEPSAPPIEEMPADDLSRWLSEKDSSQDTQSPYLTADESFDMTELQRRVEQMKIGGNILSPHVDDGQMRKIRRLTDTQLKAELRKVGIVAGPMCARTRGMYEKKLVAMRREAADVKGIRYSHQLERAMLDESTAERGKPLDEQVREEFKLDGVSAFCYLLLDPRRICDDVESLDLKSFVPAIFYVGKGTKARPLAHLIEAKREKAIKSPKTVSNRKLQRIDSIWEHGRGVLCLQINHNVSDDEAFVREAALIEAIKLENLTNVKGGEWRGKSKAWTLPMKAEFGTYQLLRAMGVLKIEGIRPIFPQALPDSLYPFAQKKNAKT